jgi:raffinose/stachyose/melibiose transport system substrate-binding protein
MWGGLGLGGEFVLAGASAPLDAAYAKYHWDQRFVPAALIDTKRYKGQRHGVPFLIHAQGFYFNQALFKKAGIAGAPATYDELVADARKLKAAGIPAIVFGGSVNWHLMRLMDVILEAECGAKTHDALTSMTASWAATPCAAASFGQLKLWTSEFTLQPFMGLADDQAQGLFYAGRTAMALEGDWFVSMLRDHDVDGIGFFQPPTGTHRLYFFSEQLYVGARSAHKDEDEQFLDFITSPAEQQKYVGKMSAVSVDRGIDYGKLDDPLDVALRAALSSSDATYANGDQAFPLDVTTEYWRVINLVAEGTMEPAAAAADMQDFIARRHH